MFTFDPKQVVKGEPDVVSRSVVMTQWWHESRALKLTPQWVITNSLFSIHSFIHPSLLSIKLINFYFWWSHTGNQLSNQFSVVFNERTLSDYYITYYYKYYKLIFKTEMCVLCDCLCVCFVCVLHLAHTLYLSLFHTTYHIILKSENPRARMQSSVSVTLVQCFEQRVWQ